MHKYITALKRLINIPKYPLYRTTPLRFVFLHLLILSIILSSPAIINIYNSTDIIKQLVTHKQSEIPSFSIEEHQLKIEHEKTIAIHDNTITFTKQQNGPSTDFITFSKNELKIKNINPIPYESINMFKNKDELIQLLTVYTNSSLFFVGLIALALITMQLAVTTIKVIIIAIAAHLISIMVRRKSRLMNWFKMISFIITLPTLLLFLDLVMPSALYEIFSWCIIGVLVLSVIYYLPKLQLKTK